LNISSTIFSNLLNGNIKSELGKYDENRIHLPTYIQLNMNTFSTEIYNQIIAIFPQLEGHNKPNTELLEFNLENDNDCELGNLYIQTSEDDHIWIRADYPFTTYAVDSVEELTYILGGIISNEMFWIVAYDEEEWDDSFFAIKGHELEMEEGITYKLLSWNGLEDQVIKANLDDK